MKKDRQISIRLADDTVEALGKLADDDRRPLAAYMRLILERHVEEAAKRKSRARV